MTHLTTTTTENIWSSIKRTNTQVPNLEWNRQLLCTTEFKAERYSYYDDNNDSMKKKNKLTKNSMQNQRCKFVSIETSLVRN